MKIISWNCNGKFREKFKEIIKYDADIYVIQECENPKNSKLNDYILFAENYVWIGENQNRGLGIFAKPNIKMGKSALKSYCLRYFLSTKINNQFDLLAVWAYKPYIEEYYIYQNINLDSYHDKLIAIGDFNSNKIWDKKHGTRSHSQVVNELNQKGFISAYHYLNHEEQGKESQNTFYLYRKKDRGYHIDYCFLHQEMLCDYQILNDDKWLKFSDHLPILLTIVDEKK